MTSALMGSLEYLILLLMDSLAFAPVAGANDANHFVPICEAHGKNSSARGSEAVEAFFGLAMREIASDDALRVKECLLGEDKADAVLLLVLCTLSRSHSKLVVIAGG